MHVRCRLKLGQVLAAGMKRKPQEATFTQEASSSPVRQPLQSLCTQQGSRESSRADQKPGLPQDTVAAGARAKAVRHNGTTPQGMLRPGGRSLPNVGNPMQLEGLLRHVAASYRCIYEVQGAVNVSMHVAKQHACMPLCQQVLRHGRDRVRWPHDCSMWHHVCMRPSCGHNLHTYGILIRCQTLQAAGCMPGIQCGSA